jgi:transposase-like protein
MEPNSHIKYSEAFKQQVVREVESGKFRCSNHASRAYGIKGATTVTRWLREYGRTDLLPKQITIMTMNEKDETKALKQRVRQLETALADAHMKGLLSDAYLQIACEGLGLEVDQFKKKHVTGLSPKSPSKVQP